MRKGEVLTAARFHELFPQHEVVTKLGGAFPRGVPTCMDLADPSKSDLFRRLLQAGTVQGSDPETIEICHRSGWIYADDYGNYSLPSPLHVALLSWYLLPIGNFPEFSSIFKLSLETISKFSPTRLQRPIRRIGGSPTAPPLEAYYQDEFYRCLYHLTLGNCPVSIEFASANTVRPAGCIDFFLDHKKWGIEITRDGSRLQEHASRFESTGAYGAWLTTNDMLDYILLDCRKSKPRVSYPGVIISETQTN